MDELEKKETAAEEEAVPAENEEQLNEQDALVKELEEIRDMFQEAIDNAGSEESSDEEEDDDYGEDEAEGEASDEDSEDDDDYFGFRPMCECCEMKTVSGHYGEDYPYCDDCRELMKKYPMRFGGIVAILAMIIVFGLTVYFSADKLENALVVADAITVSKSGKMMSTIQALYNNPITSAESDSEVAVELLIDSFWRAGYASNAKSVIEEHYTAEELEKTSNRKYKKMVEYADRFSATQQAAEPIVSDAFAGKEFDYEAVVAKLDELKNSYIDEENGILYDGALTDYYKCELMKLEGIGLEEQLEVIRGIESADEDGSAAWIYLPAICELASKIGDEALAKEYFEKIKENNSEDMKAYISFAKYYRYLEIPDADAMIALCEEASAHAYSNGTSKDTSYYPTLVIAYLIKGEGAVALETMREYMNSNYYNVSDCNLYSLCALYCGNTEIYDQMKQTLESSGFTMSELVENYRSGEISIEEAIADMGGDIG